MNEEIRILRIIYDALEDKKGSNIRVLDISEISVMADYFVIASGLLANHIGALSDNVCDRLIESGIHPKFVEGSKEGGWILIDAGSIVVHIFTKEAREFYDIERIWSDAVPVAEFMAS